MGECFSYSACKKKWVLGAEKCFWGVKRWPAHNAYRHLWADCLDNVGSLTSYNPIGLHGRSISATALHLYMLMMFIPHRKHTYTPQPPVTGITLLSSHVDDVRTSQETLIWSSRACYEYSFTFYMWMMFVPDRKHTYWPPRSVTGIALLFYYIFHMWMMFVPHRNHTYWPPRPVTGIALLFICGWFSYLTGNTRTSLHGVSLIIWCWKRDHTFGITTDCGLENRAVWVWIPM
jgi:hypothetical protein